jgi:excisionase family DNA binding protein
VNPPEPRLGSLCTGYGGWTSRSSPSSAAPACPPPPRTESENRAIATTSHPLPDYPSRDDGPASLAALIAARSLQSSSGTGSLPEPDTEPQGLGDLPPALGVRGAAPLLGISRATAYALIRRGEFPCPVFRCGGRYKIPTAHLLDLLGLTPTRE